MSKKMNIILDYWDTPLGKVIIEAGRWAVLGAVSLFITKLIDLVPGANIDPNLQYFLLLGLKMLDSMLHKSGVAKKGIVRF
jgi:hypothetical protein